MEKEHSFTHFKFLGLKSYASQEWLADGKKKYRRVFEVGQVSYLYAELSLVNKRFDVEDWEVTVRFKCHSIGFDGQYLQEHGSMDVTQKVTKAENIAYIRQGWGHSQPGGYWQAGTYAWVASIDGVVVGSLIFYMEDAGVVTADHNPYFSVQSLRLFEGPMEVPLAADRVFVTNFVPSATRFIWAELMIQNLHRAYDWMCELKFLFYNDARELKGRNTQLVIVRPSSATMDICGGWGSDIAGTWYAGGMTLDVVFMDQVVASQRFWIGEVGEKK